MATSIGAVEAMKDQMGICRWNYTIRSLQEHVRNNVRCFTQTHLVATTNDNGWEANGAAVRNRTKRPEELVGKMMDLSCWGPSTVRF